MFTSENELQSLIHHYPELLLSGIPEINPQFCPDTPQIISLGREIYLRSGPIDNMYIDTNAVITLVECKRYTDSRLKREVYSQTINYASDLKSMLFHYSGEEFLNEFYNIVLSGSGVSFHTFDALTKTLANDPLLENKNKHDWLQQFRNRLEYNIKNGVFRIIVLCGPAPENTFSYSAIRNLMQIMQFSESSDSKYDLLLMDIREDSGKFNNRILWRNYTELPQISLLAQQSRNTAVGIERMKDRISNLSTEAKEKLNTISFLLEEQGLYLNENTFGFAIYSQKNNKSIYTQLAVNKDDILLIRNQVRPNEKLFHKIQSTEFIQFREHIDLHVKDKSKKDKPMYEIEIPLLNNKSSLKDIVLFVAQTLAV